jgi:hypothetical protein
MQRFEAEFGARPLQMTLFFAGGEAICVASDSEHVYLLGNQGARLVMPRKALEVVLAPTETEVTA